MYNSLLQRYWRIGNLSDLESWKTLLNAATIRNHEPILEIAKTLEEGELPKFTYHRGRGMRNCSTTLEPICYKIPGL